MPNLDLLYHFCRLQLPAVLLPEDRFVAHLQRMHSVHQEKTGPQKKWNEFLTDLHLLDAFLAVACQENNARAWEALFAARTGRSDQLLVDALHARAVRLYPHDQEKQETVVTDFWGHLLVAESEGAVPILTRYDGQRPLVPWLIRIFHNWQISRLRSPEQRVESLAEDDYVTVSFSLPSSTWESGESDPRWHESFCAAACSWLQGISDQDALVLGLRMRYRMSQRDVAKLLGVHEGTISRQLADLRDRSLAFIGERLQAEGWTGEDLERFIHTEMAALLLDEPRLAADRLARLLAARGKSIPN